MIDENSGKFRSDMDLENCTKLIHAAVMLNDICLLSVSCIFQSVLTNITYFPRMYITFRVISLDA